MDNTTISTLVHSESNPNGVLSANGTLASSPFPTASSSTSGVNGSLTDGLADGLVTQPTFADGFFYVFTSLDHFILLFGIGLLCVMVQRGMRAQMPAIFVASMAAALAISLMTVKANVLSGALAIETVMVAGLFLLAGLLSAGTSLRYGTRSLPLLAAIVTSVALIQGHAHALQVSDALAVSAPCWAYGIGAVVASAIAILGGMGVGAVLERAGGKHVELGYQTAGLFVFLAGTGVAMMTA